MDGHECESMGRKRRWTREVKGKNVHAIYMQTDKEKDLITKEK